MTSMNKALIHLMSRKNIVKHELVGAKWIKDFGTINYKNKVLENGIIVFENL